MRPVLRWHALIRQKKYGFASKKGSISVGKDADFVVITDDWQVQDTFVQGERVFDKDEDGDLFNAEFIKERKD